MYDVVVVGAGHAGIEACLAASRMNKKTAIVTLSKDMIGSMPCNPSVGGPAKGIVVREIDALGGMMPVAADKTALQFKMLNTTKGPGVWSLRVQSDKIAYKRFMKKALEEQDNLDIIEAACKIVVIKDGKACGVELEDGKVMFIGYADSNGHAYKSLGREMLNRGIFNSVEEISLQSIKAWLVAHPSQIDGLLNTNPSYVFFRIMNQKATGSLGLVLTPERSVAVDRSFIPLGSLLGVKSESPNYKVEKFVFAQDTGGAIKGPNRADMFMGHGQRAEWIAGELKAPLEVWIMEPKF